VASLASFIRSAARATFSAYRTVPIRWRLAGGSAALTFVILASFAAVVGVLTSGQVRGQFKTQVGEAADQLQAQLTGKVHFPSTGHQLPDCNRLPVHLSDVASAEHDQIRIFVGDTAVCDQQALVRLSRDAEIGSVPRFPAPFSRVTYERDGYLVQTRPLKLGGGGGGSVWLLYARPLSDVDHTLARVRVFLLLGVLGGTVLALLAGLATAARAMRPVVELTEAAREIERTRDPSRRLPHPEANDEVAELALTLEDMLGALDGARGRIQTMLDRQREFVADASHELRTPLTSVLANLELLAEELEGEQADSAQAALRATRRMRRLVGDLLLLARADAKRAPPLRPTDLADVVAEAAAELGPLAEDHELSIAVTPAIVAGVRDDLHRLVLNLLENAVQHTPPGTRVTAEVSHSETTATLIVCDDGPGVEPALERRVFERFVRGAGDGGRGSGLGLAIVRAVAHSHSGEVSLERPATGTGTRFVIEIPLAGGPAEPPPQTSTTTGSTIGRRRSRS
jgi:two-component system OmpR family sensor kinase